MSFRQTNADNSATIPINNYWIELSIWFVPVNPPMIDSRIKTLYTEQMFQRTGP